MPAPSSRNRRHDHASTGLPRQYHVQPMSIRDFPAVHALWQRTEGVGLTESDSKENVAKFLRRNPGMSFVARCDRQLVGAVLCGHEGRRGYLHHLAVAPQHRRQGIGKSLVESCLAALHSAGILKCNLFVYENNAAAGDFWQKIGWAKRPDLRLMQTPTRSRTT